MWSSRVFRRSISSSSAAATAASAKKKWDAIIIGGGHNGLTSAAYLARAGLSVAVLEKRRLVGGAAVTEEIVPGFRFSRCSYLQSLLRPSVIRELELSRHGLKLLKRNPSSFTPCLDGRYLLLSHDAALNHSEISKFSEKDADAYVSYEKQLQKFCDFMDPLLDSPTPESSHGAPSFTDILKATLATDAVIGATGSVHTPGSGYVEGGMGSVSLAISKAACEAGASIITDAEVSQVLVNDDSGAVTGVMLADGTQMHSSVILSNATPYRTFLELVPQNVLPEDFLCAIRNSDYSSESFAQRCFSLIDEYAPGFSSSIVGYEMLTPPDLEKEFGLTGGNIFHGAVGLGALFLMRPVKGWSDYRTPLKGLYLCGSGAHPGGGVMGAPGRNSAHVVLEDIKKSRTT
ncbi:hypothetical protein QJS10_CPB19g00567 [Acorus calamus]|uniref:FAD dependent oxidoreductase domain-containing protein n=1 Tax=Acorus calamus TaxID=4465 RepID=A0AAV9CJ14_ACOCL|nr:hypothetical protein QJS10_CPB19g00567 [Acorus calamus]